MTPFYPHLYEEALTLLIEAREKAGLSREALAACFRLPEELITSYETGARLLDLGEFIAMCRAIGVDPYELAREAELASSSGEVAVDG
jgi:ribosome-binding protein aMBF1 (putative translation factor)